MRLGTKSQYAVMAMVDLALYQEQGPVALSAIACRQGLPIQYLEQIFPKLRRHELIKSCRGAKGGYLLNKDAHEVNIAEIIKACDESIQATRCQPTSHKGCQGGSAKCLTHDLWDGLSHHILEYLSSISLKDLCDKNNNKEAA